jgi:hypothetical protein
MVQLQVGEFLSQIVQVPLFPLGYMMRNEMQLSHNTYESSKKVIRRR